MPLGTATITYDLADMLGVDFDARRTKVWVATNVPSETVVDTDANKIRLGSGNGTISEDGTGSVTVWTPGTGANPASWQTYVHVAYPDRNTPRGRAQRTFGPFTITTSADLADLVNEQEAPPEYLLGVETALGGLVASAATSATTAAAAATTAAAAANAAEVISGLTGEDAAVANLAANPASLTSAALVTKIAAQTAGKADAADTLTIQRIDRQNTAAARAGGGAASIAYADATETTLPWADLTGVAASANAQVAGNKLYAINTDNPGGVIKSFPIGAGEVAHVAGLIYWKAGTNVGPIYVGLDYGAAGHAPAASTPDGHLIGLGTSGVVQMFNGANMSGTPLTADLAVGATPTADTTYAYTVDVGENFISMSLRKLGDADNVYTWYVNRATLATAGKVPNNLAFFVADERGTGGHAFSPAVAIKARQPARTKTLGGQSVESVEHRLIATAATAAAGTDPWRIQLPAGYDPRRPAPVVIVCHQSLTGDARTPWSEARTRPLTDALADAGYIVAAATDGGDRWGNSASLANYLSLYQTIRDRYNTGPVCLIGVSMGMLSVLNALTHRGFPTPAAVVSIGGVCNLDDLWTQAAFDDGIAAAYGISGPDAPDSEYETKTAGYNPIDRAGWEFRGVPMRFYTSTGDAAVPKATGCDVLAAKVAPYAPEATVSVKSGGHLDVSQYPPSEIVSFFQSYL